MIGGITILRPVVIVIQDTPLPPVAGKEERLRNEVVM